MLELVLETKHMPQSLALHGTVNVTAEEVAQRMGQVFIQRVRAPGMCLGADLLQTIACGWWSMCGLLAVQSIEALDSHGQHECMHVLVVDKSMQAACARVCL